MKTLFSSFLLLSSVAAPAATSGTQFNLNCTGNTEEKLSLRDDKVIPYEVVYRIDLVAKKWCEGACERKKDIARIEETNLVLTDHKSQSRTADERLLISIDRVSGTHTSIVSVVLNGRYPVSSMSLSKGHCEAAPFTGFPAVSTKF
jgi:hypothetical protein